MSLVQESDQIQKHGGILRRGLLLYLSLAGAHAGFCVGLCPEPLVRNISMGFHAFILTSRGIWQKYLIIIARHIGRISTGIKMRELMEWLRTDRNTVFPFWEERGYTFNLYPHYGML